MAIRPRAWERVVDVLPQIFPVNYALSGRMIVFRTAPGTELSYAPMTKVAFEIDDYAAPTGVGWSVMVQGVAHDATEALDDISWTARGATPRWPGVKAHWIAISSDKVTGRRFRLVRMSEHERASTRASILPVCGAP